MTKHQQQVGAVIQADPAVATVAMVIGGNGQALNSGRMYITLKPRDERDVDAFQIITRLRPKLAELEGMRVFLQSSQDVRTGSPGPVSGSDCQL